MTVRFPSDKDESILAFLLLLQEQTSDWQVKDYWEADLCAIGVVCPTNPGYLAHVSSWSQPPGHYYVELEQGALDTDKYEVVEEIEMAAAPQAVAAVVRHLASPGLPEETSDER
jgi:hypothetical protein